MRPKAGKLGTVYVAAILVLIYLPLLTMVIFSFNAGNLTMWEGFSLRWYGEMLSDRSLLTSLGTSLTLALCSCLLAAGVGTLGAVGMARSHFRARGALESASTIPLMLPEIVLGMAYMAFFGVLGVRMGFFTLLCAHTTFCVPYIYINVKARLAGMDKSILEAARDLGASSPRVFWDITLPLVFPAVLSGTLLAFAMSMDDVVISFFVSGTTNTLPIKVYSMIKVGVKPTVNALCTLMLAAVFLAVGVFQLLSGKKTKNQKVEGE